MITEPSLKQRSINWLRNLQIDDDDDSDSGSDDNSADVLRSVVTVAAGAPPAVPVTASPAAALVANDAGREMPRRRGELPVKERLKHLDSAKVELHLAQDSPLVTAEPAAGKANAKVAGRKRPLPSPKGGAADIAESKSNATAMDEREEVKPSAKAAAKKTRKVESPVPAARKSKRVTFKAEEEAKEKAEEKTPRKRVRAPKAKAKADDDGDVQDEQPAKKRPKRLVKRSSSRNDSLDDKDADAETAAVATDAKKEPMDTPEKKAKRTRPVKAAAPRKTKDSAANGSEKTGDSKQTKKSAEKASSRRAESAAVPERDEDVPSKAMVDEDTLEQKPKRTRPVKAAPSRKKKESAMEASERKTEETKTDKKIPARKSSVKPESPAAVEDAKEGAVVAPVQSEANAEDNKLEKQSSARSSPEQSESAAVPEESALKDAVQSEAKAQVLKDAVQSEVKAQVDNADKKSSAQTTTAGAANAAAPTVTENGAGAALAQSEGKPDDGKTDEKIPAQISSVGRGENAAAPEEAEGDSVKPETKAEADKKSSASASVPAPRVDPLSFVIPKKSKKKQGPASQQDINTAQARVNRFASPTSTRPGQPSAPKASPTNTSSSAPEADRGNLGAAGTSRRTKNPVPPELNPPGRKEKDFFRRAKHLNSFLAACEQTNDVDTNAFKSNGKMKLQQSVNRYSVFDSYGVAMKELTSKMACPLKKNLLQSDKFPPPFFGVQLVKADRTKQDEAQRPAALDTTMPCYNVLEFSSCAERDWFQNRMYGTTFVPQFLRGRTSLIARNIRYERKSTGIRFNSQRDLEEFRVALSERFRVNKSVPRCEILPKNWQMMMNKQASFVFMHYQNREDADYAARTYTDDYGAALEYKRGSGPRDNAVVAPATPSRQHTPPPRRSSSGERRDADRERDFSAARDRMRDRPPERDDRHRDGGRQFDPHHRRDDRFDDRRPGMDGRHGDSWGRERDRWHERSQFPSPRRNRDFNAHDHHSQPDWPRDDRNGRFPHRRSRSRSPRNRPMQRERGARPSFGSGRDHGTPYDSNNPGHREHVDRCDDRLDRGHGEPDRPQDRESEPRNSQNNEDIQDIEQQKEHGVGRGHDVGHDDPRQEQSTTVHDTKSDEGLGILKHMPAEDGSTQAALNSGNGRDIASNVKDESEADASDRHGTNNLPPNSTDARTEVPHGTTSENKDGNTEREQARTHDGDLDRVPEHHGDRTSQAKSHREDVLNDEHRDPVDQKEIRDSHPPGSGRSEPGELNDRDRYRHVDMDRRHNDDRVEQRRAERSDHLHRYGHRDSVDERRPDHDERDRREQWDDHERFHRYEQPDHSRRGYHDTDPRGPHERDIHDRHDRLEPREWERHGEDISKEPPHHRSRSRSRSRSRGGPRRGASPQGFSNGGHDGGRRRGKFRGHYRQKPRGRYGP